MNINSLKIQKYKLLPQILLFLLYSCANIQPPSGGPKDSSPPFIENSYPKNFTTNFLENKIIIEFSEWINRNQVVQNLSISPISEVSYSWSGRKLNIEFAKELHPNTTYFVSLGTDYADLAGNKPDSSFSLVFSTGSRIDSGKIEGYVLGDKYSNVFVYAYRIDNKNPDTINPEFTPADYKIQLGSVGSFSLMALPDGVFRILTVKTQFRDNLFHPRYDEFGTYWDDVEIKQGKSNYVTMKFAPYPDLSPISINSVSRIDKNLILLEFNKLVKIVEPKPVIVLEDSLTSKKIEIKSFYTDSIYSKKIFVNLFDSIEIGRILKVIIPQNTLTDTNQLKNNTISYFFKLNPKSTENRFVINGYPFKDSTTNIDKLEYFTFSFSKPLDTIPKDAIKLLHLKTKKDLKIDLISNKNELKISLIEDLQPDEWYRILINLARINSINGDKISDSTIKIDFKTADWNQFPSVSGKVLDSVGCAHKVILLKSKEGNYSYTAFIQNGNNWKIDHVRPGKYLIEIFCDDNQNQRYDYGKAYPYEYAEKFLQTKQEIEVKPRWNVENIMLLFKLH